MNFWSCRSSLMRCFPRNGNFKNNSNLVVDNKEDSDELIQPILHQYKSNIHVLSVDTWKQLLAARGEHLWSIRREMLSSSSLLPSLPSTSTSPAAGSKPENSIVLVIASSPSIFQSLEINYGMDKQETTMTMSPPKPPRPQSLPLTRCTGQHWENQRPKVQHGFRHIAERSRRCLDVRINIDKPFHCCSSSSSSSSSSISQLSIENVIRREILSTNTVRERQRLDLKVEVHNAVTRWIVRVFCRSNLLSLSAIERNRLQKIEEIFDCYWKSIRLPPSPPDPSPSTTSKRKHLSSFLRKNTTQNISETVMSVRDSHRLQLFQQLRDQLFNLQDMERKNHEKPNLHNQYNNSDGEPDPSSPASVPLPSPILLELALSFEGKLSDDDDDHDNMMTAIGGVGGEYQSDVVEVVITNTINAMIAAADACQSLVFWTLWNLGRNRQWWIDCRSEHTASSSAAVDTVAERTRHDLVELAALKQKATKGLKVRWYWSHNAGSSGAMSSLARPYSPSGLSMLGCAIMETARYFPPVWTLPRTINLRSDNNDSLRNNNNNKKKKKTTPSPIFVKLDVLSINKAYDVGNWNPVIKYDIDADADDENEENKSEDEDAAHEDSEDGSGCYLASFGLGKRHCPAGTASLQAAYQISQHYLRRWDEIVDVDTSDSKSTSLSRSWSYLGPTLCVEDGRWIQVHYSSDGENDEPS